jgi:hypothetical protein
VKTQSVAVFGIRSFGEMNILCFGGNYKSFCRCGEHSMTRTVEGVVGIDVSNMPTGVGLRRIWKSEDGFWGRRVGWLMYEF